MPDTGDRMTRAGNYVLGMMDDEERERAERDLEMDASFRDAVVEVAERMHVFDHAAAPDKVQNDAWKKIKESIDGMPQMRQADTAAILDPVAPADPSVSFGRRHSDACLEQPLAAAAPKVTRVGSYFMASRRVVLMAVCLIAAFASGYFAGISSVSVELRSEMVRP